MSNISRQKCKVSSLVIGLRVLAVIVLTEALIMTGMSLLHIDSDSMAAGIADTLMLASVSTVVIYYWVIRPMNQANQKNEMLGTLVRHTDVGMVATDPHQGGVITYVNPAFTHITGYSTEEAIGQNPRFLQGDDVDQAALAESSQAIKEGRATRVLQRNRRKDGSMFWNDLHLNPILDSHGQVVIWVGLVNDVTAQRELERQNANWASAMQQSDEAVCIFNEQGVIEFANEAFCANVGLEPDALIGSDIRRFLADDEISVKVISEAMHMKQSRSGRHQAQRADGRSYEALSSMTPIEQPDGSLAFVAVHRDITEMAAVEAQLRQAQKMEAVGMLVGGIAHDFNNVLAGILGNLYMIRRKLQHEPQVQQRLEAVEKQGYAAAGMVRQLLSFSRNGVAEVKVIDLVPFIRELVEFSRASVPESIELIKTLKVKHLMVCCDTVQLQQSMLNMIINATHALTEKGGNDGHIEVIVDAESPHNALKHSKHKQWARICVRDNGAGMDEETKGKIFEPFFTTRGSGVGTGLGLAMVQGYVEMLEGAITVESQPGVGTCFELFLPANAKQQDQQLTTGTELRPGNGELILLADDDKLVLQALSEILESSGYQVLSASNGEEAMALLDEYAERLDMAILDVVMPKQNGVDVGRKLEVLNSAVPIVYMTGYDRKNVLPKEELERSLMLQKPWTLPQLNTMLEVSLPVAR